MLFVNAINITETNLKKHPNKRKFSHILNFNNKIVTISREYVVRKIYVMMCGDARMLVAA